MTLREKIEVMEAFERGEEIEYSMLNSDFIDWDIATQPTFNWQAYDYRIKPKQKQVVVIEKWLFEDEDNFGIKCVVDIEKDTIECYCNEFKMTKLKLIDTYKVEL